MDVTAVVMALAVGLLVGLVIGRWLAEAGRARWDMARVWHQRQDYRRRPRRSGRRR